MKQISFSLTLAQAKVSWPRLLAHSCLPASLSHASSLLLWTLQMAQTWHLYLTIAVAVVVSAHPLLLAQGLVSPLAFLTPNPKPRQYYAPIEQP